MGNKFTTVLMSLCITLSANLAHAEVIKGHIVGYYTCGTIMCSFVTPDSGTFDFLVEDKKVANKIFKKCQAGNVCRIEGSFDVKEMVITKVTKVEDSRKAHVE